MREGERTRTREGGLSLSFSFSFSFSIQLFDDDVRTSEDVSDCSLFHSELSCIGVARLDGKKRREEVDEKKRERERDREASRHSRKRQRNDQDTSSTSSLSPHKMTVTPQFEFFPRAGGAPVSLEGKTLVVVRVFWNAEK